MGVFIPAVSLASKVKFGYSFREASALNQIRRCKIPVLFIHGEADALVPCAMVYRLYEAANCDKQLLTVPGAGHCLSASVAAKALLERCAQLYRTLYRPLKTGRHP